MNTKIEFVFDGEIIFSCDNGVNFVPNVGECVFVNEEEYEVTERIFSYKRLTVMSFCVATIYLK